MGNYDGKVLKYGPKVFKKYKDNRHLYQIAINQIATGKETSLRVSEIPFLITSYCILLRKDRTPFKLQALYYT